MLADYQRLISPPIEATPGERPGNSANEELPTDMNERQMAQAFGRVMAALAEEILHRIYAREPAFFEDLVIDLLLSMGYGGRKRDLARRLGRSGDGGVDGVIALDELGLELIYLQAKRLKPGSVVAVSDVRDFVGTLDANRAGKGIFLATGYFSPAAELFCQQVTRRVALVDGRRLTELMIRHNVGVRIRQSYQIKRLDPDYFRRNVRKA